MCSLTPSTSYWWRWTKKTCFGSRKETKRALRRTKLPQSGLRPSSTCATSASLSTRRCRCEVWRALSTDLSLATSSLASSTPPSHRPRHLPSSQASIQRKSQYWRSGRTQPLKCKWCQRQRTWKRCCCTSSTTRSAPTSRTCSTSTNLPCASAS